MFESERQILDFSPDQQAAWDAVSARLASYGIDLDSAAITPRDERTAPCEVMSVIGKAGSGKTVLLAEFAHRLTEAGLASIRPDWEPKRRTGRSFAVLAPTNKAASVLRARDRKSTRLNSSHVAISYAVF